MGVFWRDRLRGGRSRGAAATGTLVFLVASVARATAQTPVPGVDLPPSAAVAPSATPIPVALNSCGTIRIRTDAPVDSAHARPGDLFHFTTVDPVRVDAAMMLPAGTPGIGIVTLAQHAGRGGKGGFISLDPRYVKMPGGGDVHVLIEPSSNASVTGKSNNVPGEVGIIPGMGIVAGAYGFIHHGSDIVVPAGTTLKVWVGDEETVTKCRS